jgi:hypothetical protein
MCRTHAWAWKLTKAVVKATSGDDWEMLAPTNDGCVTRSMNSKAHKWIVQVIANRDELKVITTKYYEHFYSENRGMLQSNYLQGGLQMMCSTSIVAKTPLPTPENSLIRFSRC